MKTSRYSDSQIINILNQAEAGTPVAQLCREHGMSDATFYKWRAKVGGMDVSMMARLKELEDENRRLKKMYAEERLKSEIIQEAESPRVCRRVYILRANHDLGVALSRREQFLAIAYKVHCGWCEVVYPLVSYAPD